LAREAVVDRLAVGRSVVPVAAVHRGRCQRLPGSGHRSFV